MYEIALEAPAGAKFLIVTMPDHTSYDACLQIQETLEGMAKKIRQAATDDDWPFIITVANGVTVRWAEAVR
jgi:hypothetical protein